MPLRSRPIPIGTYQEIHACAIRLTILARRGVQRAFGRATHCQRL